MVLMADYLGGCPICTRIKFTSVGGATTSALERDDTGTGKRGRTGVNCDAANGRHIWQLFKCDNNNVPSPIEKGHGEG